MILLRILERVKWVVQHVSIFQFLELFIQCFLIIIELLDHLICNLEPFVFHFLGQRIDGSTRNALDHSCLEIQSSSLRVLTGKRR